MKEAIVAITVSAFQNKFSVTSRIDVQEAAFLEDSHLDPQKNKTGVAPGLA